jgi:ribonuclease BN (tRNA processing enzyme)
LKLTILGYAATPRTSTNPTSQILEIKNRLFLSIVRGLSAASQNKIRFSKINHVFISHLHGDHSFWIGGFSVHIYLAQPSNGSSHLWSQRAEIKVTITFV